MSELPIQDVYHEMANFMTLFGPSDRLNLGPELFRWKIQENPTSPGHLFLERHNNKVAGSASLTPKPLLLSGRVTLGAEIGDTYTHSDFRRQGIFGRGVNECTQFGLSQGVELIYGTPNENSLPGYENKMGYIRCPKAKVVRLYKPISFLLVGELISRRVGSTRMGHLLAPLYTSLERFTSLRLSGSSRQNVVVETLERFPDGIDGSWGDRENFAFFTRRNTAYLNWRFVQNPHSYLLFGASCSGCLVGYIVVRIFKQNLYRVAVLADFAVKDDRADIFVPLLITVEKRMKAIGIDKMELWASETLPYYSPLRKLKYRPAGSVNVIVFTQTAAASELLAIDKPWHFTIADSDNV